jgi:hypothetical protein
MREFNISGFVHFLHSAEYLYLKTASRQKPVASRQPPEASRQKPVASSQPLVASCQ